MNENKDVISIRRATAEDAPLLSVIGKQTILESHGHSAPEADMQHYLQQNFSEDAMTEELNNPENLYHILNLNGQPAGYSKIVLNIPHPDVAAPHVTKLSRIYILREFYARQLGEKLLHFNVDLTKQNQQFGMWLNVWIENERAIRFYRKQGFLVVGKYDFEVSPTHINPNHVMFLNYA